MEQTGFRIIGTPEGIEHLGGVDLDETVFRWVRDAASINDSESVTANVAGLARLRHDCVGAKEALSTDVEAVVPVSLGDAPTTVRLTRYEFEGLVRPAPGRDCCGNPPRNPFRRNDPGGDIDHCVGRRVVPDSVDQRDAHERTPAAGGPRHPPPSTT